jgi:hypothetical protein
MSSSSPVTTTLPGLPSRSTTNTSPGSLDLECAAEAPKYDGGLRAVGEDDLHKDCTHPKLPEQTNIIIDIDLQGNTTPSISALTDASESQKPNTARIYLCYTCQDARDIFQRLGMAESQRYVETTIKYGNNETSFPSPEDIHTFRLDGRERSLFYDPRRLFEWLRIALGTTTLYHLPEYVVGQKDHDGSSTELIVQHQIRLSRDSDNRYSVVWFDFRDLYSVEGYRLEQFSNRPRLSTVSSAECRRHFAYSFYHTPAPHCATAQHINNFPCLLMLDILRLDLSMAEAWILKDLSILPVQSLRESSLGTVHTSITERLTTFAARKVLIAKMEGLQTYTACLKTLHLPSFLDPAQHPAFQAAAEDLALTSSFLHSEIRRRNNDAEELLALHTRVAQGRQASSMSALTYCAALFLPLSLAASFLSMQNRARDMDMMTYDFLGVASVFGTIAALAFAGQRRFSRLILRMWTQEQYDGGQRLYYRQRLYHGLRVFYSFGWILLVVTFFIGMFSRRPAAPFGSAAIGALLFISFVVLCALAWAGRRMIAPKERPKAKRRQRKSTNQKKKAAKLHV